MPLEFNGDSAFESTCLLLQVKPSLIFYAVTKPLALFAIAVDALGIFFNPRAEPYVRLFFQNANSGYAEVRSPLFPRPKDWRLNPTLDSAAHLSESLSCFEPPMAAVVPFDTSILRCLC